jgi:hypothetical protein
VGIWVVFEDPKIVFAGGYTGFYKIKMLLRWKYLTENQSRCVLNRWATAKAPGTQNLVRKGRRNESIKMDRPCFFAGKSLLAYLFVKCYVSSVCSHLDSPFYYPFNGNAVSGVHLCHYYMAQGPTEMSCHITTYAGNRLQNY